MKHKSEPKLGFMLAGTCGDYESLAALGAAALERRFSIFGPHTGTEPVDLCPLSLLRLIRSFGHKSM